jgi:hypothetical protein
MAEGTYLPADSPDDPIYTGRFVVSSHNRKPPQETPAEKATPEERYPDLQNLPIDPAEAALEGIDKPSED